MTKKLCMLQEVEQKEKSIFQFGIHGLRPRPSSCQPLFTEHKNA